MFSKKLRNEIEITAEAAGIGMAEVCARAKVPYTTWWKWTKGKLKPNLDSVDRLIAALDRIRKAK